MLKKMSLKMKLMTGFVSVAIIAVIIGGVGIVSLKKLDAAETKIYEMMTVPLAQIGDI
jgi:methyl-accepting chemotaxis protein